MTHYSQTRGLVSRSRYRYDEGDVSEPNAPSLPNYRERMQETVTTLPCGLTRVDLGHPIGAPLPPSAGATRPDFTPEPNPAPVVELASLSARTSPPKNWKDDYGLAKSG